ncbi:hypothetical protein OUHCRE13_42390 [Enterobacter roggenkampii]
MLNKKIVTGQSLTHFGKSGSIWKDEMSLPYRVRTLYFDKKNHSVGVMVKEVNLTLLEIRYVFLLLI